MNGTIGRRMAAAAMALVMAALPALAQDREALEKELKEIDRRRAEILRQLGDGAAATESREGVPVPLVESEPRSSTTKRERADTLLDEVQVVATRWEEDRGRTLPLVDVVEGRWFEDHQQAQVSEGLRHVPGVTVSRSGGLGSRTSVFLRGALSTQTLVLQDGIPLNDPTTGGGFDFFDMDALNLERVEVLRGSYGVLYGSDAMGGVINLVTKKGEGPATFRSSVMGGSFRTHRESISGSGGDDAGHWSFGAAFTGSGNDGDDQDFDSTSFSGRFGGRIGTEGTFDVTVRHLDSQEDEPYDFGNPIPEDRNITLERELLALGVSAELPVREDVSVRLRASVTDIDSHFRNLADGGAGAPEFVSTSDATTRLLGVSTRARVLDGGAEGLSLTVVAGFDHETEESVNYNDSAFGGGLGIDDETQNRGVYGHVTAEFGPGILAAGVRRDNHTLATETSPQVSGQVHLDRSNTTVRANWGEGFRSPTPIEFADPFSGNPALTPETSESVDVSVEQDLGAGLIGEVAWFRLRTEDLIAYDFTTFRLENFNRTRNDGYEIALRGDLGHGLRGRASFTHQRPRDSKTGLQRPNRPDDFAALSVEWERGDWLVFADLSWQGTVLDQGVTGPDADLRAHAGRRTLLDLGARFRISDQWTAFGRINNLLNDEYVENPRAARGLPIGVFLGVAWEF